MTGGEGAMDIYVSLTGPDARERFKRSAALPAFKGRVPATLPIDDDEEPVDKKWSDRILAADSGWADFGSEAEKVAWSKRGQVWVGLTDLPKDPMAVVEPFAGLPFELASTKPIHKGWTKTGKWTAETWGHH